MGGILGAQGPGPDGRTGQGSCPDERPPEDTYKEGMGAARPLPALGPAVTVPQRGPLLLLALSLGLACAQQMLEEVPVQPGFNAQKVTEPGRVPARPWDGDEGPGVSWWHSASRSRGERPREGQGRPQPRPSICPGHRAPS